MNLHDALLAILIAVNLLGGILLKRWIDSLRGTVEAQKTALDAVHRVLDTVMNVFKATDPDRWAKEVAVHKELADKKVAALLDEERRNAEERIQQVDDRARAFYLPLAQLHEEALGAAIRLLAELPKDGRATIIREIGLHRINEEPLLKAATELPEPLAESAFHTALKTLMQGMTKTHYDPH